MTSTLARRRRRPVDLGLGVGGLGTILGAVNMVTTVVSARTRRRRCSGCRSSWNILVTSVLILLIFPLLTAALLGVRSTAPSVHTSSTPPTAV